MRLSGQRPGSGRILLSLAFPTRNGGAFPRKGQLCLCDHSGFRRQEARSGLWHTRGPLTRSPRPHSPAPAQVLLGDSRARRG